VGGRMGRGLWLLVLVLVLLVSSSIWYRHGGVLALECCSVLRQRGVWAASLSLVGRQTWCR
jgi:hypothetical protein